MTSETFPKWIKEWTEKEHCDECSRPNRERLPEVVMALEIAWNALEKINEKSLVYWAQSAMDEIRSLEKPE